MRMFAGLVTAFMRCFWFRLHHPRRARANPYDEHEASGQDGADKPRLHHLILRPIA